MIGGHVIKGKNSTIVVEGEIVYIGLAHCGKEVEVKWIEK